MTARLCFLSVCQPALTTMFVWSSGHCFLLWAKFLNEAMPGDAPSDLHSIVKNVMSPRDALAVSGSSVFEVLWRYFLCRLGGPCKHAC